MDITLSKYSGFCDGVGRAYDIVKKMANDPKVKKPIYILGSLVHNQDVVRKIEGMGIRKIDVPNDLESIFIDSTRKIGTLVITAHGIGPKIYDLAKKRGVTLVDTTCPKVTKVQRLAKVFLSRLYQIVIIGDRDHKEVKGIFEWAQKKAFFIESEEDISKIKLDSSRNIAVVSQTTQNSEFVKIVADKLLKKFPKMELIDTICRTTQNRQDEVRKIASENEAVVVIGSTTSANSTRLWQIAKSVNSKSYFIENESQIDVKNFSKFKRIGVTAGASTPDEVISGVLSKLRKM